jgi:gas vesicle protein
MWRRRERESRASRFEEHHVGRAIALIAAGIGIGSGIALLMAPNSGEEVRHAIGRRYLKTMKRLGRSTEGLRDRLEDMLELAKDLRGAKARRFLRRRAIAERLRAA